MAPDPAVTNLPLAWTQEVVLFPGAPPDAADTPHLCGLVRCLYLAVTVAGAHGEIGPAEMESFHRVIVPQVKNEAHWPALRATEAALRRDPNVALRSLPQIARAIPAESRSAVLGMMVRIAAADGEISLDELKILRRMAKVFELDADAVENILHSDESFREVTIEAATGGGKAAGEPTPRPGAASPAFALDRERIKALMQETREVISLLSVVMAEPEDAPAVAAVPASAPGVSPEPPVTGTAADDWLVELDPRYRSALRLLIERDEWTLAEFDGLAERHHLLPDDLFDSVNTWSDEVLGDFLLVKVDTVRVFRLLLPAK